MNRLGCSDAGEVAVTLIGEHQPVRPETLGGAGECRSPTVGGLLPVNIYVLVGEHGAAYRRDGDRLVGHAHLLDHLGDYLVHHSVAATRAVMHRSVIQQGRFLIDNLSFLDYFFSCHCVFRFRTDV